MNQLFAIDKYKDSSVGKKLSCISCGLFRHCHSPKMQPTGGFKKGIMNIGEFPSKTDDEENGKFLGKGRILKRVYARYGIDLEEDCINLNALACSPKDFKDPKKLNKSIDSCRKFVMAAIEKYKPKIIVLLGDMAVKSVIGNRWKKDLDTIHKWRGFRIPDQDLHAFLCPTFAPSYVYVSETEVETMFEKDIQGIAEILHAPFPVFKEPEIEEIEDLSVLKKITGMTAFDYEATGLKPYNKGHKIWCASIATGPDHVYVFKIPKDPIQRKYFKRYLKNHNISKVAQNMKYEDTWSRVILKTKVQGWVWDTQIASHMLDNRPGITGLKFQTYVNFGIIDYASEVTPYLEAKDANSKNRLLEFVKTPENATKVLKYCGYDSIFEYRLMEMQTNTIGYDFLPF